MQVNKHVIIATGIIVAGGLIKQWQQPNGTISQVLLGGLIFMIPLGVLDLFGGGASKVASGLAMLAATTVILTQIPWASIFKAAGVKTA